MESSAQTVTWTARILAYRRLEIRQLQPFYEKSVVQPIALCEPSD